MKKLFRIVASAACVWLLLPVFTHGDVAQKAEWKGKIETENGIKVIRNPGIPLYGDIKLDLAEDLSIGREGDPNLQFFGVRDVAVDPQGNIYVADMKNYRVQKFDKDGKYLLSIGRQGQGPGEFELPTKVRIDEKTSDVYVLDRSMLVRIFNQEGGYLNRDIHLKNVIIDFQVTADGDLMAVLWRSSDADLTNAHALCRVNPKGDILGTYGEFPYTIFMKRMAEGTLLASSSFELSLQLAKLDPETFVYGYSKDYELGVIDKNGRWLHKIKTDEPLPQFSSNEKADFKKIPVPKQKPYFFSILTDSDGRIYVQRNLGATGRGIVDRENLRVDVFDREGRFIFKTSLPPNTKILRDGRLYAYAVDEEKGMEYVKRYKIKNWQDLKKLQ
jgi:hypothetical protein